MDENLTIELNVLKFANRGLKQLVIPEGVKAVGYHACFSSKFEEISFPNSLERIGSSAFESCHNLKRIVLPTNLKIIDSLAFCHCSNLEEVILPDGIEFIGAYAFKGTKIKKIYLPRSLKIIREDAFSSDEKIKIYCEDEPQPDWINKIKEEKIIESYRTSEGDAFNFHRSSGGWDTIDEVVGIKKIELLWSGKNAEVFVHVRKEDYQKEIEK